LSNQVIGVQRKVGLTRTAAELAVSVNGSAAVTDSTASTSVVYDSITLGGFSFDTGLDAHVYIQSLVFYAALNNTVLASRTAI
jgi:hypothetical protein